MGEVLSTRILGVPPAGGPLLLLPTAQADRGNSPNSCWQNLTHDGMPKSVVNNKKSLRVTNVKLQMSLIYNESLWLVFYKVMYLPRQCHYSPWWRQQWQPRWQQSKREISPRPLLSFSCSWFCLLEGRRKIAVPHCTGTKSPGFSSDSGKNVCPSAIQNCPRNIEHSSSSEDSFGWHEDGHFLPVSRENRVILTL